MKKPFLIRILAGFIGIAVLLPFTACSPGAAQSSDGPTVSFSSSVGGELVYGMQTQPDHLDPYLAATADTRQILFNIFEGLVKPDKDGNLIPAVAESHTVSPDAKTYTFQIRKGIRFHNGNSVTAADVKYSLDLAAGLSGGKILVPELSGIQSVETSGASTVKIHLKKADYDFLPYLTVAILPKGYTQQDTHPIGTGPFEFESYMPQQSLVLKKNPDYWQKGLPHMDRVTFKLETDSNALLLDLQGGSVDGAGIANNVASQLGSGFQVVQTNSNSIQLLAMNNKSGPFKNKLVRQAVSYALNPDEIIQTASLGKGVRSGTPVIPGLKKYFDSSLTHAYDQNTAKAKQLLTEAGYPNGFSFTITVPSNYTVHVDTAQVMVSELKKAGITAQIKQVDFATWLSKVYTNREYEGTVISVDGAALTPKSILSRYVSNAPKNFFNYSNPQYDALFAKAASEPDETKRIALYKQAQAFLSKDAACVFIQDISMLNALKDGISGFTGYPLYVFDASTLTRSK